MVLRKEIGNQIKDILKENPQGLSITDIVKAVNINRNTAGRYLENLLVSGQVEMRRFGMAKIYMLSQRVPLSAVLSLSSELVMQLDSSLRIIFANEPFHNLVGTDSKNLLGKNIEYTPVALVFDDLFPGFLKNIREGLTGKEWSGDILLPTKDLILFCRIAPTVFEDGRKGVSVLLENITGKKRSEMTLQESEERYRKLVDISPDAVLIHQEGKIIFINPAALILMGASHSDEIIGKNILDIIQPEFRDAVRKNIEKDLGGDITPPTEVYMSRVDGTSVIVEGRGIRTFFDGKPAVQVAIRDITERKRAEEALRESEERLRLIIDSTDDLIIMQDLEGRYLYFNSAARYGISLEKILGSTPYDFIDRAAADRNVERVKNVAKTGQSIREETPFVWKGQTLWFSDSMSPVRDVHGTISAVVTVSHNITERKRAEEGLRESEEKYRTLIDRANDVICVIQDGIVKMCNPRLTEFWGGAVEEMLGRPFTNFVHPDAISEVVSYYNRRMSGESFPSIYETVLMRKDGSRFYAELNAGIISYEGKTADLVIIRDINERKKAEETLRESEATSRALINAPTDSVILTDIQRKILALNETAALRFGKRSDELVGMRVDDLLPKEIMKTRRPLMDQVIEKKMMVHFEDERDGRWYDTVAYPITSGTGEVIKIAIIAREISERKKADIQLRESEERLRFILDSTDDLVFMQDLEGRYLYFNSAARYGVSKEQALGLTPYEFIDRESADRIIERVKNVVKTGQNIREDTPVVWKGETLWFSDSMSPVRDVHGTITAVVTVSHNITERKRAEMALHESEEKYRTLVDRASDVICVIQDGIVKMCNPRLTEFWGGVVEEMLGRPFTDFVHPDALSEVIDRYNRRMSGESLPSIYDTILMRKDGSRFYAELNAGIISYEGKTADLVIIRDINDRKKAQDALRESEATALALINAPTDSVILMDIQGVILALNETAALRFGKRSDELIGVLADDLLPEEIARTRRSLIAQVVEKGEVVRFEDERDGSWYDTVAYPITSGTGEVIKIAIIARDITDRRNTEEALSQSEQRFRNLITSIGDIIWETDAQARFVYVSPQVETILGYKPDELIGHTPFEFLHPDAIGPTQKKFQTAFERYEKSVLHVSHWIHKDGNKVLLETNAIPMYDSNGSFSGFIGIDRHR